MAEFGFDVSTGTDTPTGLTAHAALQTGIGVGRLARLVVRLAPAVQETRRSVC